MIKFMFSFKGWSKNRKEQRESKLCTPRSFMKALFIPTRVICRMSLGGWAFRCLEAWRLQVQCCSSTSESCFDLRLTIFKLNTNLYRTVPAVVFWQFVNQSFNALVNYTNRNANSPITTTQLGIAYVSATSAALVASLGYKSYLQKGANPFFQRYAPFAAVAVANCNK